MAMPVATQTFNLIDPIRPELLLSGLEHAVDVTVHYLPSKIAPPTRPYIATPLVAHRISIPAWGSVRQPLDPAHAAFLGGFGAIRLEALLPALFYGYLLDETDVCVPITGPELIGALFRVPLTGDPAGVKIAVTNVSGVLSTLEFTVRGARPLVHAAMLGPGVTYLFEPASVGWSPALPSTIEVHTGQLSVCSARVARKGRASLIYPLPG